MKYNTPTSYRRHVRTLIASLLSYMLLTSQLAPMALAFNSDAAWNLPVKTSDIARESAREAVPRNADATANPFAPMPVPLTVAAAGLAPTITATKVDTYPSAPNPALPGEIIRYTVTITNTGPDPATNVTLSDTVDVNTTIVGTPKSTPIGFADAYSVLGNVRIQVPDGLSDLLANDRDPDTDTNAGLTITTLAGDNTAPFAGNSTQGGQVTAASGNGSFEYNPPAGFTGSDTFTYIVSDADGSSQPVTVTLTVTGLIWFVNSAAPVGGTGRLTAPFNCYTGTSSGAQTCFSDTAADDPGDIVFLFSGNYIGGNTLLNNQRLIGQGATDTVANIAGVTVPPNSDALPATGGANPIITTAVAATNGVSLGQGNLLRGFTVGNTTGAKIFGNNFGTLTAGNNASPDLLLNGTGQALNLTTGTFAATSGFNSVTTTSSGGQGISLTSVAGTAVFGSTTVSGSTTQGILVNTSTADINFGNTSVSGGTDGVSLQNNSSGTRTFGTLSISNNSGAGFLHAVGGGNATITGATTIPAAAQTAPVGTGIDIQSLAGGTAVTFAATTVNKGNAGTGVNLGGAAAGNVGNVTFNSLAITTSNGSGLVGTNNGGQINVTTNAGNIASTNGPVINITKAGAPATPITLNFGTVSSTNSTTQGINLDLVSGNMAVTTTTITNPTGTGIQVQNTSAGGTMNFGNTAANNSGNANVDATGTGVFLNANAGNVTFGDLDISPDANERALQSTNSTGTLTTTSGDITATGNVTIEIVGLSLVSPTPLAMVLNNVDSTNSNGIGVNLNFVSGNLTVNDPGVATNIQNPSGIGIQVLNTAAGGTMNFSNSVVNGSGGIGVVLGTAGNGNAGNITFADLDITPDSTQRAFVAIDNTGTLTNTTGDITTSGAGNRAIEIDGPAGRTPINLQFTSITTTGASNSVSLVDISGTKFQVTGTTQINTRAGTGVFVDNSTATNIQFGTTNIPNPSAAGGYGIRVEDSSSVVTVATATISDANLVTAQNDADTDGIPNTDGDGDAIFLTNNTGSFTLNGGTLSNCGNDCIDLRNSSTLVLSGVNISTPGLDVTGATGAGFGGHNISAINLTGTSSITGGTISGFNVASRDGLYLTNTTSTALTLTIDGTTFQNAIGNRGIGIQGRNAANMTVTATNCTFSNILGTALQSSAGASVGSTATVNLTVQNSTFQNAPTDGKNNLIAGVLEAAKSTLLIQNNTFNNVFITASSGEALININNDGTLAGNQLGLTLQGNNINNVGSSANNCAGGAVGCRGPVNTVLIFIDDAGNVPNTLVVDNNTLTNVQQGGIFLDMANTGGPASAVNAKITNNCIGRLRVAGACTGADARVGIGVGLASGRGISVERRRNNSPNGNVLIAANTVFNGAGQNAGTLNTPGIFTRTKANSNLSATVLNNVVDTNFVGAAEMRFDTNANDVGDIVAPTQCVDISGNTFPAAVLAIIDINETNGTHNVEQASAAAVTLANGGVTVTADAGVSFNVACATPPAAPETFGDKIPGPGGAPGEIGSPGAPGDVGTPGAPAPQTAASDSITARPFISSPREETVKATTKPTVETTVARRPPVETEGNAKPQPIAPPKPADDPGGNPPVIGPGGTSLTWNVGTLPAGQSVTLIFDVQVENPYSGPPQVSNQGSVSFGGGGGPVLTDDPSVGGGADPTVTPIAVPPDVFIRNAKVAEPTSGSTSMLFTVALSTPAAQSTTINYSTANGTAVEPGDYTVAAGSITFLVGEQIKTIPITVNSDADATEVDENFTVTISANPTVANIVVPTGTGTITVANPAGTVLISELRTFGPGPGNAPSDEFVEIYNNTDTPLTVTASDASPGFGLFKMGVGSCDATPVLVGTIPNGTIIPARGHYLFVGATYSLAAYATGNATLTADIDMNANIGLFDTTNILNLSTVTRLDAVGEGTNTTNLCALLAEGNNLAALNSNLTSLGQHSFFRSLFTPGTPKDTNDNAADFLFVDTNGTSAGAGQRLGAPGPENLASPIKRDLSVVLLDASVSGPTPPNRVRDLTPDIPNNSTFGTLSIRRRIVNTTGAPVTRLRFRIVDITTFPPPAGTADIRGRTSGALMGVAVNDGATCAATGTPATAPCTVTVQGTTLETPPTQPNGAGYNATLAAGTITVGTPLAAGASVNLQFLVGVQQTGNFRIFVIVEALP
ncbi:MAG: Calx-beta domain-containing protein [Pyrinomonadaceae bacterium]